MAYVCINQPDNLRAILITHYHRIAEAFSYMTVSFRNFPWILMTFKRCCFWRVHIMLWRVWQNRNDFAVFDEYKLLLYFLSSIFFCYSSCQSNISVRHLRSSKHLWQSVAKCIRRILRDEIRSPHCWCALTKWGIDIDIDIDIDIENAIAVVKSFEDKVMTLANTLEEQNSTILMSVLRRHLTILAVSHAVSI